MSSNESKVNNLKPVELIAICGGVSYEFLNSLKPLRLKSGVSLSDDAPYVSRPVVSRRVNKDFSVKSSDPITEFRISKSVTLKDVGKILGARFALSRGFSPGRTLNHIYGAFADKKSKIRLSARYPLPVSNSFIESITIKDPEMQRRYSSLTFPPLGESVWKSISDYPNSAESNNAKWGNTVLGFAPVKFLLYKHIRFFDLYMRVARNATNPLRIPPALTLKEFARLYGKA